MAKVEDGELVMLIEQAIDRYVTSSSVNPDNVCQSVAQIIVRELRRAGTTVIREQRRNRTGDGRVTVLRRVQPMGA